ncbi:MULTISPECIES: MFS transporter [Priestia]|jgi:MFS family permease|uniref:MFS transporter n=4 Tax=Priestia TaxID=2800373 RepID=A0ABD4WTZ1_PRIMG|nr:MULTISPECIES: MFS transporter [Priestia]KQU26508.1 MFS transporter [Bacillus sp. Leaf75]KRF53398.1 MFS transporter [Bacillus sp. Soil531]MCF6795357.1 MFS transporter [Bacillus sp. ET1]MEB2273806.1 MFS transporter [Bacillus sp. ILBB4]ADE68535.1 major facilitator transporter family protein (putative permease) [Priestia megaterium QM B1551]
MKNKYMLSASGMYINYFLLGMVNIMLASNMSFLTKQLNTDGAGISYIISAIGIGKLLSYSLSGILSDKFGRKPLILVSSLTMAIFLIGIPLSPNYPTAFIFAIIAGIANSAMDAGTYPALIEVFPKSSGSASVLVKAFISAGAALLPFMIAFFADRDLFYGYAFFLPALIYLLNMIFMFKLPFPNHKREQSTVQQQNTAENKFISPPKMKQEGIALIVIGFTSTALFTVAQIWLPTYGQQVLGMAESSSVRLLSYYSIGALISVLVLAVLLSKVLRPVTVILVYPMITLIAVLTLLFVKVPTIAIVAAFFMGFSTAGVFQLAITVMTELFWNKKGTVTGIVATAAGLAAILLPLATGLMSKTGHISIIFIFDAMLSVVGMAAAAFVNYRYRKILNKNRREQIQETAS